MVTCQPCNFEICEDCLKLDTIPRFIVQDQSIAQTSFVGNTKGEFAIRPNSIKIKVDKYGAMTGTADDLTIKGFKYNKYMSYYLYDKKKVQ